MKKILKYLIVLFSVMIFIPVVNAKKVTLYMFSKEGCPNCETAETYFNGLLEKNKDEFEYVIMEAFDEHGNVENEDAKDLMVATLEEFNQDPTLYFPTIVVGDNIHIGAGNLPDVYEYIKEASNDSEYKDKIQELANKLDINIKDIRRISTEKKEKQESSKDAIILVVIFIVVIGGLGGLLLLGKK